MLTFVTKIHIVNSKFTIYMYMNDIVIMVSAKCAVWYTNMLENTQRDRGKVPNAKSSTITHVLLK